METTEPSLLKDAPDRAKNDDFDVLEKIEPLGAKNNLLPTKNGQLSVQPGNLRVYRRRWIVLAVISLLNNINTMSWIAFSPVANHVDAFYMPTSAYWLSGIFLICTVPVGIAAMWAGRQFGLRSSILIGVWTNGVGALVRLLSSILSPTFFIERTYIAYLGQGIAALAYPFIMFLPTKVAAAWFPDNQRALATTIGVMANPLGILIANLVSPRIVQSCSDVLYLNIFTAVPSLLIALVASITITRSEPPHPPTISASHEYFDFFKGIKVCFTSKQYCILLFVMGGGIGMFNCLYVVMQELLCSTGYSNIFSGYMSALLICGGVIGATLAGTFVDRTKLYEEAMKFSMAFAVVAGIVFLQLVLHSDIGYAIAIACFIFGVFGLAAYPVGLQLSAECTFPVSETTSTGLIICMGQIQSMIYLSVMKYFARVGKHEFKEIQVCSIKNDSASVSVVNACRAITSQDVQEVNAKDMTNSTIAMSVIATCLVVLLILTFKPRYRRMEVDQNETGTELLERTKTKLDKENNLKLEVN